MNVVRMIALLFRELLPPQRREQLAPLYLLVKRLRRRRKRKEGGGVLAVEGAMVQVVGRPGGM